MSCKGKDGTCLGIGLDEARASSTYGAYQYYLSFGGDQFFNIPTIIDNNFGVLGLGIHVAHFIGGMSFELAGYTAYGN